MKKLVKLSRRMNGMAMLGALVIAVAEASALSTCCLFIFNQPEVPERLRK